MIHSPVILSAAAVLLVAQLPGGLAGPALAKKQWGGWSPSQPCGGEVYGRDQPWWIFASVTSGSWGSFTSQACETGYVIFLANMATESHPVVAFLVRQTALRCRLLPTLRPPRTFLAKSLL